MVRREVREQARQLRRQGVSIGEIAAALGVSKSTASLWVRDVPLTEAQIEILINNRRQNKGRLKGAQANRERFRALRLGYQQNGRTKAREGRSLHLAGCMLYWAEGVKSPNNVYFVNSDANMMCLFMRFLREELSVPDALMSIRIHCHTQDEVEKRRIERYWLDLLLLPDSCLRRTLFKQGSEKSKHVLQNGICSVRVHRVEYVQHIYGAIQEYAGFENPAWLF
jgi:hypothetical protein